MLFLDKYCPARGLRPNTIASYRDSLDRFRLWATLRIGKNCEPDELRTTDILDYVRHLRDERLNSDASVNTGLVIVRSFYRAMVAMEQLEHKKNPTLHLPKIKAPKRRVHDTLTQEEVKRLINKPGSETVMGLRDRAILSLLYGTGIRASECAHLKESSVDFEARTIVVTGKGGHQRTVPLNAGVLEALERYREARGRVGLDQPFFRTRRKRGASRGVIYNRVRRFVRLARIQKRVTPHTLRHTFATHLVRLGEKLIVIRDLLGHRQLSSTQVYLHMTGEDLRNAVDRHPVGKLLDSLGDLLPGVKLPLQFPPGTRFALNNH